MKKLYILLFVPFAFVSIKGYSQTNRATSVLFHETFETNSPTLSSWTTTPSTGCTAYNWTTQNNSGKGALGSAGYWLYQSSASAAGCYATAVTPTFTVTSVDNKDSVAIDLYIYRSATTSTDYISIVIMDENNSPVYGPYAAFANDAKNPPSSPGWCHLTWNMSYNTNIYDNITTKGFKVGFTGISDHGVDLLLDEVTVSHSFTHSAGISELYNGEKYFSCYPNPAHNSLNLQFSDVLSENTTLNLYNMNGKQVMSKSLPAGSSEASLDIHDIIGGVYILEIKNNAIIRKQEVLVY